jgi:transposase
MAKGELTNKLTIREFFKRFPDEAACLEHVMDVRFGLRHTCGKCGVPDATFHRLENRKAYACAHCGNHLYPCAGTIFQDSRTPLQLWFYGVYLFVASRHGVSGKELQRQLGVTYKTGWRMARQIRLLMEKADGESILSGHVEADEVYLGGQRRGIGSGQYRSTSTIVLGLKERGGRLVTKVVPAAKTTIIREFFDKHVEPGSMVSTDQSRVYHLVKDNWLHGSVNHGLKEYARRDPNTGQTIHVNSLENFWGHFQASVRGTHVHISPKHTQKYLAEFTFRSNHRHIGNAMFDALIAAL